MKYVLNYCIVMAMLWLVLGFFPIVLGDTTFTPLFPNLDIALPAARSPACQRDASLLFQGLRNQSLWAMQMWDSSSQGSTGALYGNMWQLGNFDECLRVREPIRTQYCLLTVQSEVSGHREYDNVWDLIQESNDPSYLPRGILHKAVCVPAACSAADLQEAFQAQMDLKNQTQGISYKISVNSDLCTDTNEGDDFTLGEIFFWAFCGLIIIVSILGTLLRNKKSGGIVSIFRCFSIPDNVGRLLNVRAAESNHSLAVLHGVKVISIVLVFYGHRVGVPLGLGVSNYQEVEELRRTPHNMFMPQADLVVDSFFFISGVLATFIMCEMLLKKPINPFHALLARLSRIAPTYYFIVWLQASAAMRLGSGPVWRLIQKKESGTCADYWWANIFFFNNYLPAENMCHVHSWYLPCDMHFFVIALVLVNILTRQPLMGKTLLALLILLTPLIPAYLVYTYDMEPIIMFYDSFLSNPRSSEVFGSLYIRSDLRVTVYLIGIAVGYFLCRQSQSKHIMTKVNVVWSTILGVCLLFTPMAIGSLYYHKDPPGQVFTAIFAALRRPLWALGLTVLLLVHRFGPKNIVSRILVSKPALILSKLTFSIYLIHYLLILYNVAKTRTSTPFTFFNLLVQGSGDLITSCTYAAVLYILLELPMKRLTREVAFSKSVEKAEISKTCPPPQEIVTAKL